MKKVFTIILLLLIATPAFGASQWVQDPTTCNTVDATNFPGQSCSPVDICGDSGGTAQCYDTSLISLPVGASAPSVTNYSSSYNGGYVLNCYATVDGSAPYCDNGGAWWCDRNETCYSTNNKTTVCDGGAYTYTCGSCRTGYQDCDATPTICEVQTGVTAQDEDHTVYAAACGYACASGYLDCDGDIGTGGDGCEVLDGDACSVGGLTGEYNGCSGGVGNCVLPIIDWPVGIETLYSTSSAMLWGVQYGTGDFIYMEDDTGVDFFKIDVFGNGTTTGSFYADNLASANNVTVGDTLKVSQIIQGVFGGGIDLSGNPWYLSGTDFEIANDLIVDGSITLGGVPRTTWPSGSSGGTDVNWVYNSTTEIYYPATSTATVIIPYGRIASLNSTSTNAGNLRVFNDAQIDGNATTTGQFTSNWGSKFGGLTSDGLAQNNYVKIKEFLYGGALSVPIIEFDSNSLPLAGIPGVTTHRLGGVLEGLAIMESDSEGSDLSSINWGFPKTFYSGIDGNNAIIYYNTTTNTLHFANGAGYIFDSTAIVNGSLFVSDDQDGTDENGILYLGREDGGWEALSFDNANSRFQFSNDLYVNGNATTTGHLASLGGNSDQWNYAFSNMWTTTSEQNFWNTTTSWAYFDTNWARNYNATTTLNGFTPSDYLLTNNFSTYFNTYYNATTTLNGFTPSDYLATTDFANYFATNYNATTTLNGFTDNSTNWNTAFSWGDWSLSALSLANWYATTTDGLDEGITNLYWTNDRFDDRYNATTTLNGFTNNSANWDTAYSWGDWSGQGFITDLSGFDTDDLAEGSNLYFTDARVANYINSSSTIQTYFSYADLAYSWGDHSLAGYLLQSDWEATTTDALAEGSINLYYTDARVADYINASTTMNVSNNLSEYNNDAGFITSGGGTTFVATTTDKYDGNIGGYVTANTTCDTAYTDSHLCTDGEIMSYIARGGDITDWGADSSTGWFAEVAPGYLANANDCAGFTSNSATYLGAFYVFNATDGGYGALVNCSNEKPLICCK